MLPEKTRCRSCGAEIYWVTRNGKKSMPVNAEPVKVRRDYHGYQYFKLDGEEIRGLQAEDVEDEQNAKFEEAYVSHFVSCPQAIEWRRTHNRRKKGGGNK